MISPPRDRPSRALLPWTWRAADRWLRGKPYPIDDPDDFAAVCEAFCDLSAEEIRQ